MPIRRNTSSKFRLQQKTLGLHFNKLQAVSCLTACIAVGVALILWGAKTFG